MLESFAEADFIARQYEFVHREVTARGTPELPTYLHQLRETKLQEGTIVELHVIELSTYFKNFLLLTKAVLDKLVPLYSYQFHDGLRQFEDKGTQLLACIRRSKKVVRKDALIQLLTVAKREWLDQLIHLRDRYAHYSDLPEYRSFWLTAGDVPKEDLTGISDFTPPTISIEGTLVNAVDFVRDTKERLVVFLHDFLMLCDFAADRRPNTYLRCDECQYVFAVREKSGARRGRIRLASSPIQIEVKDRARDYGLVICPKCGGETDTDLKFWIREGLIISKDVPA